MFEPNNSTLKCIFEARSETELFSVTTEILEARDISHFLIKNAHINRGIPVQLMQRFSDKTTELLTKLSASDRDPITKISRNSYVPCDIFQFREDFADDSLIMDFYKRLDNEGANPFYLFSLHIPGTEVQIFCVSRTSGNSIPIGEIHLLHCIFLYVSFLSAKFIQSEQALSKISMLTRREREVLYLMAQGLTDKEIGETLKISLVTVGFHVKNAKAKLGAKNKCHAIYLSGLCEKGPLDQIYFNMIDAKRLLAQ